MDVNIPWEMNCSSKKADMGKRSSASSEHPRGNAHLGTCSAPSFPRGLNCKGTFIQKLSMLPSSCTAQFRASALGLEAAERVPMSDLWGLAGASSDLRAWVSCPGRVLPVKWSHQTDAETKARLLSRGLIRRHLQWIETLRKRQESQTTEWWTLSFQVRAVASTGHCCRLVWQIPAFRWYNRWAKMGGESELIFPKPPLLGQSCVDPSPSVSIWQLYEVGNIIPPFQIRLLVCNNWAMSFKWSVWIQGSKLKSHKAYIFTLLSWPPYQFLSLILGWPHPSRWDEPISPGHFQLIPVEWAKLTIASPFTLKEYPVWSPYLICFWLK